MRRRTPVTVENVPVWPILLYQGASKRHGKRLTLQRESSVHSCLTTYVHSDYPFAPMPELLADGKPHLTIYHFLFQRQLL